MLRHLVHMSREFTFGKGDSLATASRAKRVALGHSEWHPARKVREVERALTVARAERRTYDPEQGRIGRTVNSGSVTEQVALWRHGAREGHYDSCWFHCCSLVLS